MNTKKSMKSLLLITAGLAATSAGAADYYWVGGAPGNQTNWDSTKNWQVGGSTATSLPGAGDDVHIPDVTYQPQVMSNTTVNSIEVADDASFSFNGAYTLTLDDAQLDILGDGFVDIDNAATIRLEAADALQIAASGGSLNVYANGTLEIVAASSSDHVVNGQVKLLQAGSLLDVQDDNTFSGSGSIIGFDDQAQLFIAASKTFQIELPVAGAMLVDGGSGAAFDNRDEVVANDSDDPIEFSASVTLQDSGTPNAEAFKVQDGGHMIFKNDATLTSSFLVEDANSELEIDAGFDVISCGALEFNAGQITIGSGATFQYVGYSGTCANPADSGSGADCSNRYVVSATESCM